MTKFPMKKLSELCSEILDCVNKTAPESADVTPFKMLRTSNIRNGIIDYENVKYVSEETYMKWTRRGKLKKGDIVFTREAPLGEVGMLHEADGYFLGQRLVLFRADETCCYNRFLLYALQFHDVKESITSSGVGATVVHMRVPECANISVPCPCLSLQKKIGDTLYHYDELIENNRRQIKLLEEAAQRLYKEWFVDLRFPGHEHTPIVNGIPQGWQRHIFADLIQKEIGGGWGKECEEGRYDVSAYVIRGTDIEHVAVGEYAVPYRYHTRTNFDARKLRNGDIIFEVSGGGKNEGVAKTLRVTSGMLGMWEERAICASFCKLVRLQDDVYSCYISDALKYLRATKQTESYENRSASSIINFRWTDFLNNQEFIIPEKNTMLQYYEMSNAVYEKQVALAKSISCATEARDRLLPKLMSGEVEV